MCNNCLHKEVCSKFLATGGHVRECDHFKEERKGHWEKVNYTGYVRCSCCKDVYINEDWLQDGRWNGCPKCFADLRGAKNA